MISNLSIANAPYLGLPGTGVVDLAGRTHIFTNDQFGSTSNGGMTLFGQQGATHIGTDYTAPAAQPNPFAVVNQAQSMLAEVFNKLTSSNIDSALGALTTQKNQLISKYNSGNVSNELKTVIKEQVDQLENYERQLNYLKANGGNLDPQTAYQRSEYIKHGVTNLINLSTTTIKAMEAQSTQAAQQASETQQGQKPEEDALEAKAQKVKNDNIYTRAGEDDLNPDEVSGKYYDELIKDLYDSMKGIGTDDKKLEESMNKINKNNVIELMFMWNQKYPNESLMEMFMADADSHQKKEFGEKVATALEQAAADLGIDLSNDEDMKAIKKEVHNSWVWINNDVADNYNNIVKKLLAAAGVEYNYSPYSMFSK